ncbi:MAG: beta-lactamase [Mucilaginibacter sp.]|nr:beta-lactamase [Mucilaginibacter sp.]
MKQISDKVYQISLGMVNVFLIEDDGLTLIDTGPKGSADKIFNAIEKGGKDPNDIKQVIITHAHPDHAGSAEEIKRRLEVPLLASQKDAVLMRFGIAGRRDIQLSPGIINWLVYHLIIKRAGVIIEPVLVDESLNDNQVIPIAGGIQVIHTPGHSAGHIALLIKNEGVLIAGDICANMGGPGLSVVYENRELGIQSIIKAAELDFDIAVFGHGKPIWQHANRVLREKFERLNFSLI